MIDLKGKVILVTGGSRGIGAGIVETLVKAGADVVVNYNSGGKEAAALAKRIGESQCKLVQADLGDVNGPKKLWDEGVAWKGRIDVLVNNAAIRPSMPLDSAYDEFDAMWMKTLRVNLVSHAHLCRLAIQHWRKRKGGTIISISSRPAFRGDRPDFYHDGASKAGLTALARGIARFEAEHEVMSFVVVPGMIASEQLEDFIRHYGHDEAVKEIPLRELGKPKDVAVVVAFLASGLARYSTGATFDVNGASYIR
jgi:NAD(P)-dependent dehydrogenase (short-subunit alcohol dehydrogenase family)